MEMERERKRGLRQGCTPPPPSVLLVYTPMAWWEMVGRCGRRALGPQKERGRGSCIRTVCRGISKPLRVGLCAMEVNLRFCPTTCEEEKFFSLVIALFCTPPSARPGPSSSLIHLRTTSRGGGRVAAASQRSRRIWLSWSPRALMTSTTATDRICEE